MVCQRKVCYLPIKHGNYYWRNSPQYTFLHVQGTVNNGDNNIFEKKWSRLLINKFNRLNWAVVVAQLAERSLIIPDQRSVVRIQSPANFYNEYFSVYCYISICWKDKINKKRPRMTRFLIQAENATTDSRTICLWGTPCASQLLMTKGPNHKHSIYCIYKLSNRMIDSVTFRPSIFRPWIFWPWSLCKNIAKLT